jgi:hypothetical protein
MLSPPDPASIRRKKCLRYEIRERLMKAKDNKRRGAE